MELTRRQREILDFLKKNARAFVHPPTLDELCAALKMRSRGSLHKHVQALVAAGYVYPLQGRQRGITLTPRATGCEETLPLLGNIAAGCPIEALAQPEFLEVPPQLRTRGNCYVLRVRGDSMIEAGILDGDFVVIEAKDRARNGEIVVALIDHAEVTLKRIEQRPDMVLLHAANARMAPLRYRPEQITIQGVVVGLMRSYGA